MLRLRLWERLRARRSVLGVAAVGLSGFFLLGTLTVSPWESERGQIQAQEPAPEEDPPELVPPPEPPDPEAVSLVGHPVPEPSNIGDFVSDKLAAIKLGKAFFWDVQSGSDGKVACASCHYHAGVDQRLKNQFNPGATAPGEWHGPNADISVGDFPFHKLTDPTMPESGDNPVVYDTGEVLGSAGVVGKDFVRVRAHGGEELGTHRDTPNHNIGGCNTRQTTGRQTPTTINAIFGIEMFWDGRAHRHFNGVNPDGDLDPDARVWCLDEGTGEVSKVRVHLENAALASQAVGPIRSDVEMIWKGRTVEDLGKKMLKLRALAKQKVHPNDSVLGDCARLEGAGLRKEFTYSRMVRDAFHRKWWGHHGPVGDTDYTQMESNFTLFWGLSIQLYVATLVSDDAPYDRFLNGDENAISDLAKEGDDIFDGAGKCVNCHKPPTYSGTDVTTVGNEIVEFMFMDDGEASFYDNGFYNIGVRPTEEDLGRAGHSFVERLQAGEDVDLGDQEVTGIMGHRIAVRGAFKTMTLRNIELTGPYMHNGGMKSLEEVVDFYVRGTNFGNHPDRDVDVGGIPSLQGDSREAKRGRRALVAFLKALTDDRVRYQMAPFDHPAIKIFPGHGECDPETGIALDHVTRIPAVGAEGSTRPLRSFEAACKRAERLRQQAAETEEPPKDEEPTDEPPKDEPLKDEPLKDEPLKDEPPKDEPPKDEPKK